MKGAFSLADPIIIWIIFAMFALFSGYIVAANRDALLKSITTYAQIIILMVFIVDFSRQEGSNLFFAKSFAFVSLVYALSMLFFGYRDIYGRVTISASSNPNGDGLVLLSGVFCFLYLTDYGRIGRVFFSFIIVLFFSYMIALTASRKSFLGVIVLVVLWLLLILFKELKKLSLLNRTKTLFIISLIAILGISVLLSGIRESFLIYKLSKGMEDASNQERISMYREAFSYLRESPLVGIGYKQYEILSPWQTYSHSTYSEIISCTGIIGTILYFIPYCLIIYKLIYVYLLRRKSEVGTQALMYLVLMTVMLLLGTGVIHFYSITDNIMFALMISFCAQSLSDIKKEGAQVSRNREKPRLGLY